MIEFWVPGIPKPAGSKRAFAHATTGRIMVLDACRGSKDWKADVAAVAHQNRPAEPLSGPVSLTMRFHMPRPKSHYQAKGGLKDSAPGWHTSRPDATKLLRGVEDALTGIIWRDDAQVCKQEVLKIYSMSSGVEIEIEAIVASGQPPQEVPA